jgi:hypothetical protein
MAIYIGDLPVQLIDQKSVLRQLPYPSPLVELPAYRLIDTVCGAYSAPFTFL